MTPVPLPDVECKRHYPVLIVGDVTNAVDFYTKKLGFHQGFLLGDPPTFAGVNLDQVSVFLKMGTPNNCEYEVSFIVGDADALYEYHRGNGVEVIVPIDDRDYQIRDYRVIDPYGNHLTFGHCL